jgi:predicted HAD superfamily Cof-like phosphohydrolase
VSVDHIRLAQTDVRHFHHLLDVTIGETPGIRDPQLRESLMREELWETINAIRTNRLPEAVDGLCDLIYVALGTAVTFGVDLEPHWLAVVKANNAKVGGAVRDDGKRLKPDGWAEPNHIVLLAKQGWKPYA